MLFGFTNCPDVCPLAMERLRALNDAKTLDSDDVHYVMISVDGERDTPAAMKEFLAKYSGDFVGLTAPPARVKPIAEQFSASFFKGEHHHDGGYDVAHSPQIFVLDTRAAARRALRRLDRGDDGRRESAGGGAALDRRSASARRPDVGP